jgi:hypothetical protein
VIFKLAGCEHAKDNRSIGPGCLFPLFLPSRCFCAANGAKPLCHRPETPVRRKKSLPSSGFGKPRWQPQPIILKFPDKDNADRDRLAKRGCASSISRKRLLPRCPKADQRYCQRPGNRLSGRTGPLTGLTPTSWNGQKRERRARRSWCFRRLTTRIWAR